MYEIDLELTGIVDNGHIERQVADIWSIPGFLELRGDDWLSQKWDIPERNMLKNISPGPGLLQEFVRLAQESDPNRFLSYAKSWGVLGLCGHNLPASHNPRPKWQTRASVGRYCIPVTEDDGTHVESLADWRKYSLQAQTILSAATRLLKGDSVTDQDWDVLQMSLPRPDSHLWDVGSPWRRLTMAVNAWLALGDVHVEFRLGNDGVGQVFTGGYGLFGALAVQIALATARAEILAVCTACTEAYFPKRKPRAGSRNFCPSCGPKAGQRFASRDYRTRQRPDNVDPNPLTLN